jgi:signal transduction histidine kinase
MGNAIKFTFTGRISVHIDFNDGVLTTEVVDTGIGMKPEDLQKLFRFFGCLSKSKDINRGGMGLGLTISKMIITQLHGEIGVTSEPGVGSKFFFYIPIDEAKSDEPEEVKCDIIKGSLMNDEDDNANLNSEEDDE